LIESAIEALEQEPKTGHWIYDKETDKAVCSECNVFCFADNLGRIETSFCPWCGADMSNAKKTGHWISYWDEEARCYVYKCPECGNKQPFDTKCCWECGTRLIVSQESEE
jgi:uncharacterized paraquat-inducible protein A